ncbi:neural proliferation differentiation and control protein 1 [Cricetulus griseus]|nr:neural proliferation differentiation and control protein 1 [Cricetulus griseus]
MSPDVFLGVCSHLVSSGPQRGSCVFVSVSLGFPVGFPFSSWAEKVPEGGQGEDLPQPRLEEEIDSLAQELALKEKEAGHARLTAPPLPEAAQKLLEPVLILAFCLASTAALAVAALCWCRLQREIRLTQKADYAATAKAPTSSTTPRISPGDQRLAHSAEMYHYQHQRQQMLCLERMCTGYRLISGESVASLVKKTSDLDMVAMHLDGRSL